jgi:hypothetical protein
MTSMLCFLSHFIVVRTLLSPHCLHFFFDIAPPQELAVTILLSDSEFDYFGYFMSTIMQYLSFSGYIISLYISSRFIHVFVNYRILFFIAK